MQPNPQPSQEGSPPTEQTFGAPRLPNEIKAGIVLTSVGLAFTVSSYGWVYLAMNMRLTSTITSYMQVTLTLGLAQQLSLGLGFFLIFWGVLRLLPRVGFWSRLGPLLILIGAILGAVASAADLALVASLFSPSGNTSSITFYEMVTVAGVSGNVVVTLGTVLALVAVAFGALAQRRSLNAPPGSGPR